MKRVAAVLTAVSVLLIACSSPARKSKLSAGDAGESPGSPSPTRDLVRDKSGDLKAKESPGNNSGALAAGGGERPSSGYLTAPPKTSVAQPSPTPGACPDPRTCGRFLINGTNDGTKLKGWRQDPDGKVRIRFSINPDPIGADATPAEIEGVILESTRTWASASPLLDFIYLGRTTRTPTKGDGYNDFAIGSSVEYGWDSEAHLIEADVIRDFIRPKNVWTPCEQADGSCTDTGKGELENLVTHELGHVLGLSDLGHGAHDEDELNMTMYSGPSPPNNSRYRVTLALGDVLGIRTLYPCECPMPYIYVP